MNFTCYWTSYIVNLIFEGFSVTDTKIIIENKYDMTLQLFSGHSVIIFNDNSCSIYDIIDFTIAEISVKDSQYTNRDELINTLSSTVKK